MIPASFYVSGSSLLLTAESLDDITADPRGFVHIWHPPKPNAKYIMALDPTVGITGWSRASRTDNDHKTDNAAIEIFEVDALKVDLFKDVRQPDGTLLQVPDIDPVTKLQRYVTQDLQVCEFFAPIDPVDSAKVANTLGRIYRGDAEDQCEFIFEAWPGPGILTVQEILRLNYGNLWYWEYIDGPAEMTNRIGWRSTRESQRMLWTRHRRHLMKDQACILSPWLLAEYADAVIDPEKMRAKAAYGSHDDLVQAAGMCFWAGHRWTQDTESSHEPVTQQPVLDYQRMAPTPGDYRSYRDYVQDVVDSWG